MKLLLTALFFVLCASPLSWAAASDGENSVQGPGGSERLQEKAFEQAGLKKLTGDRFILDLKYASQDNFLQQDVYSPFGLDACYVHPELHAKLLKLHDRLAAEGLRLVIYDCFRPLEVQRAMWKILPDARYVANPAKGSLHNRGIAIDCALADENGGYLEFPTAFDSFEQTAWQGHVCPRDQREPCLNRDRLRGLMQEAGLTTIRTEWWHYQLPNSSRYPLIDIGKSTP